MRHAQTRLSIPSSKLGLDYPSNPSLLLSNFLLLAANTVAYGPTASPIRYFTHSWAQLDREETFRFVSAFATLNAFPSWRRRLAETIVELSSVRGPHVCIQRVHLRHEYPPTLPDIVIPFTPSLKYLLPWPPCPYRPLHQALKKRSDRSSASEHRTLRMATTDPCPILLFSLKPFCSVTRVSPWTPFLTTWPNILLGPSAVVLNFPNRDITA
ncbi:hypothetical protein PtB15_3B396 [Puccinia triticina]|nr:hypothetical protein PtB15_3B396 [Puccinia triticina]